MRLLNACFAALGALLFTRWASAYELDRRVDAFEGELQAKLSRLGFLSAVEAVPIIEGAARAHALEIEALRSEPHVLRASDALEVVDALKKLGVYEPSRAHAHVHEGMIGDVYLTVRGTMSGSAWLWKLSRTIDHTFQVDRGLVELNVHLPPLPVPIPAASGLVLTSVPSQVAIAIRPNTRARDRDAVRTVKTPTRIELVPGEYELTIYRHRYQYWRSVETVEPGVMKEVPTIKLRRMAPRPPFEGPEIAPDLGVFVRYDDGVSYRALSALANGEVDVNLGSGLDCTYTDPTRALGRLLDREGLSRWVATEPEWQGPYGYGPGLERGVRYAEIYLHAYGRDERPDHLPPHFDEVLAGALGWLRQGETLTQLQDDVARACDVNGVPIYASINPASGRVVSLELPTFATPRMHRCVSTIAALTQFSPVPAPTCTPVILVSQGPTLAVE